MAQKTIRLPQICPKCGGEVVFRQEMVTFPGPLKTTIYCQDCGWKEEYDDVDSVIVGDAVIDPEEGVQEVRGMQELHVLAERPGTGEGGA